MYSLMMLSLAVVLASGAAGRPRAADTLKIVALGDSLTSGHGIGKSQAYPAVLERSLREANLPFTVVNHGVSGDTTAGGVRRIEAALAENPDILILALGANDGLRGVPVPAVRRNLEQAIEAAQARGVRVLLCGMDALPLYGWQYTMDFHQIYPELAAKYNVPLADMVHPNAAGARAIAANIFPYLQELAAGLVATS
jgi:acyl-CoA thioesterase-1